MGLLGTSPRFLNQNGRTDFHAWQWPGRLPNKTSFWLIWQNGQLSYLSSRIRPNESANRSRIVTEFVGALATLHACVCVFERTMKARKLRLGARTFDWNST